MINERVWTGSNIISIARILLVPPIVYLLFVDTTETRWWAAALILLAIVTDFLDGWYARKFHQVSEFGKIIDPLADKIAVAGVALALVMIRAVPLWYFAVVIARDVLILFGGLAIHKKKRVIPQSNMSGKIAVTLIAIYLLLATIQVESLEFLREALLWLSVALMTISLGVYAQRLFVGRKVHTKE